MCGIAGVISKEKVKIEELNIMANSLYHRGPDNIGIWQNDGVGLVSTRLSIQDIDERSNMPLIDFSKRYIIVYNGEVYNFKELKRELESLGCSFKTESDTEVILNAYITWGDKCFKKFNGMWAVAIFDTLSHNLVLCRDFFGKKTIYFHKQQGTIYFASEVKSIWKVVEQPLQYSEKRLFEFLAIDHTWNTLFQGVDAVQAGEIVKIDTKKIEITRYKYFNIIDLIDSNEYHRLNRSSSHNVKEELKEKLEKSIRYRLISDAPVGVMCSGGIDSSLISIMAKNQNTSLEAYMADVPHNQRLLNDGINSFDISEYKYAEQVTNKYNIKLNTFVLTKELFIKEIVKNTYYNDFPSAHLSSIAMYYISQMARDNGAKVLLSGEAADEIFGGYGSRYKHYWIGNKIKRWFNFNNILPSRLSKYLEKSDIIYDNLFKAISPKNFSLLASSSLDRYSNYHVIKQEMLQYMPKDEASIEAMMATDLDNYIQSILLRQDRSPMEASIESRVPFLDVNVVKFGINLPLKHKINYTTDKIILKHLMSDYMNKSFVNRNKVGFGVPFYLKEVNYNNLLKNGFVENVLGKNILSMDDSPYFFNKIIAIEIWAKIFIERKDLNEIDELLKF